jgi:hypothetical protein
MAMDNSTCTAFEGARQLATGPAWKVALAVKHALEEDTGRTLLIFEDGTGRQIDFDLRGDDETVAARLKPPEQIRETPRAPGRPKLGVVAREVTLLPRHWEWLAGQPGGASVTLRKLVETARAAGGDRERVRQAQAAADRFMSAMLGDQPGYEEASRALYAGKRETFAGLVEPWPADLREHLWRLAAPAFTGG